LREHGSHKERAGDKERAVTKETALFTDVTSLLHHAIYFVIRAKPRDLRFSGPFWKKCFAP